MCRCRSLWGDDVLVKVRACGVNNTDINLRMR
jgi:NADPH:quinone reductase-like Zn-dependent oxidoreductase